MLKVGGEHSISRLLRFGAVGKRHPPKHYNLWFQQPTCLNELFALSNIQFGHQNKRRCQSTGDLPTTAGELPQIKSASQRWAEVNKVKKPISSGNSYVPAQNFAKKKPVLARTPPGIVTNINDVLKEELVVESSPANPAVVKRSPSRPTSARATLVRTEEAAKKAVALLYELKKNTVHACDTETTGIDPTKESPVGKGRVICFSIYSGMLVDFTSVGETIEVRDVDANEQAVSSEHNTSAAEQGYSKEEGASATSRRNKRSSRLWVDTNGPESQQILEVFRPWFEDPSVKKVWHNYSFDRHVLANMGIQAKGFWADTHHMARLWDSSRVEKGGYKLSKLSTDLLGAGKEDLKLVFGRGKLKKDGTPGKVLVLPDTVELQTDPATFNAWVNYSTKDTECTYDVYHVLRKRLKEMECTGDPAFFRTAIKRNQLDVYENFWRPFGELLTEIEAAGVQIDSKHLLEQSEHAERDMKKAEDKFLEWAASLCPDGHLMNPNSALQIRHMLFGSLTVKFLKEYKVEAMGHKFDKGKVQTLAWTDAQAAIDAGAAEWEPEHDGECITDSEFKLVSVDNVEGVVEPGKTRPTRKRTIALRGVKLRPLKYTDGKQAATSQDVINALAGKPFADPPRYGSAYEDLGGGEEGKAACEALGYLQQADAIGTLVQTFLKTLPEMVDANQRIHTSLNLNTETGRLSSTRPNLQNQPALEKDKYKVRKAFCSAPGKKLIVADYGQLELRIMAHMTKCKSMIDAFKAGGDFHSRTAVDMYDHVRKAVDTNQVLLEWDPSQGNAPLPMLKDVFANERKRAKTLNFSIAYGKTKHGLAKDWGVSVKEAEETINRWYAARKEVKDWQDQTIALARQRQYCTTLMGRRRMLPFIRAGIYKQQRESERAAINTPIQGGAADVVIMAMIKIWNNEKLRNLGWKMVLQIHDELMLEGPEETAEAAFEEVRKCMEHPLPRPLLVDLPVDGSIASNWFDAK